MDLVIYTGATELSDAFVTSTTDLTPVADLGTLVFGDSEPITVKFTTNAAGTAPAWLGQAGYVVNLFLGGLSANGSGLLAASNNFTYSAPTYSGALELSSADLASFINGSRGGRGYLQLLLSVTTPSAGTETFATAQVYVTGTIPAQGTTASTPADYATYQACLDAQTAAEAAQAAAEAAATEASQTATYQATVAAKDAAEQAALAAAQSETNAGNSESAAQLAENNAETAETNAATAQAAAEAAAAAATAVVLSNVGPDFAARNPTTGYHHPTTGAAYATFPVGTFDYGLNDFTLNLRELITAAPASEGPIWRSHSTGNSRAELRLTTGRVLKLRFVDSGGTPTDYTLGTYALTLSQTENAILTADRDGNAVLYAYGTTAATVSIAASAAVNIGSGNSNAGDLYASAPGVTLEFLHLNLALSALDAAILAREGPAGLPRYLHATGAGVVLNTTDFAGGANLGGATLTPTSWIGTNQAGAVTRAEARAQRTFLAGKTYFASFTTPDFAAGIGSGERFEFGIRDGSTNGSVVAAAITTTRGVVDTNSVYLTSAGDYQVTLVPTANSAATGRLQFTMTETAATEHEVTAFNAVTLGFLGWWRFDQNTGYTVADRSGGKRPILLSSTIGWLIDGADTIRIPIQSMTSDGYIQADQSIVPAGYTVYAVEIVRTAGSGTGTLTLRKTSSGGTTIATGTLAANVTLTTTPTAFPTADKLHLANSSWSSSTLTGFIYARRNT